MATDATTELARFVSDQLHSLKSVSNLLVSNTTAEEGIVPQAYTTATIPSTYMLKEEEVCPGTPVA